MAGAQFPLTPKVPVQNPDLVFRSRYQRREWETEPMTAEDAGLTLFPPDQKIILTVDDYANEPANDYRGRCDGESDKYAGDPFDYYHDHQLYSYQQAVKIMTFIGKQICMMSAAHNEISITTLATYLENELDYDILLEDRFGPLDTNSERYTILREHLKLAVFEEYHNWVENSNQILKEHPFPATSRADQISEVTKLLVCHYWGANSAGFVTDNDPRLKQSPNVFRSHMEPYKVPRLEPTEFIVQALKNTNIGDPSLDVAASLANISLNPCFEPSIRIPGAVAPIETKFYSEHRLFHNIVQILLKYPLGVSPKYLLKEYKKEFNSEAIIDNLDMRTMRSLGYLNFEELLIARDDFFKICNSDFVKLVFPACREKIASVNTILKKLHHNILLMLRFLTEQQAQRDRMSKVETKTDVKIKLDDVTVALANIFGIRFNLEHWDYDNNSNTDGSSTDDSKIKNSFTFFNSLLNQHDAGFMEIISEKSESFSIHFLKLTDCNTDQRERSVLEKKSQECGFEILDFGAFGSELPSMPRAFENRNFINLDLTDFVPVNTNIVAVVDFIQTKQTYFVRLDFMISPLKFYVSLLESMQSRDAFIVVMTSKYNEWMKNVQNDLCMAVSLTSIEVNYSYVAYFYDDEWVRAKVVAGNKELGIFKLFLIDLGLHVEKVVVNDMKKLHKDFVAFPAQTFSCRLEFQNMAKVYNITEDATAKSFPEEVLNVFYDTLLFQVLGIIPLKRIDSFVDWEVKGFLVDSPETGNIIVSDILKSLICLDLSVEEQCEQEIEWTTNS